MIRVIEDARARLAMKKSLIRVALQLLDHVRANVYAALSAAFAANFRERNPPVALGDALVVVHQIFRHGGDRGGAHGFRGGQFFLSRVILGLNRLAFLVGGRFDFLNSRFGGLHLPVILLAGNHALKQAVFGFGDFVFGILDFVQQGFVRFVGLDLAALVPVFLRALFPLLDIHLVRFAFFLAGEQCFLGRGYFLPRSRNSPFHFRQTLWKTCQALANANQTKINGLQFNQ